MLHQIVANNHLYKITIHLFRSTNEKVVHHTLNIESNHCANFDRAPISLDHRDRLNSWRIVSVNWPHLVAISVTFSSVLVLVKVNKTWIFQLRSYNEWYKWNHDTQNVYSNSETWLLIQLSAQVSWTKVKVINDQKQSQFLTEESKSIWFNENFQYIFHDEWTFSPLNYSLWFLGKEDFVN